MRFAAGIFLLPLLALWAAPPVPYYGKVSIDGVNYHGSAQFSFSLQDGNGTEHWRNGADANESIRVFVVNGRYSVMLGGQGMNPLPPELFLQHEELYLSVSFDKGDGPRTLGPEQLITATPRALVAEMAKKLPAGAITSDMLSPEVLSKLDASQSAAPMGPITLDMLPAEVLADLNKSAPAITSITRDMLPADVLADLNKTAPAVGPITLSMLAPEVTAKLESNASAGISGPITRDMLPADVLADLNKSAPAVGPITLSMLDAEVTAKFDSNTSGTTTVNNPPAVGSLIAIPYGDSAPAGYSLYQQGTPKELVWEEKAPVSVARSGKSVILDGQIYFVGGRSSIGVYHREAERYDPLANTWETLPSMASKRMSLALCKLGTKIYAVGGKNDGKDPGLKSTEIYDTASNQWLDGINLPNPVYSAKALDFADSIFLFCGKNGEENVNSVFQLSLEGTAWVEKTQRSVGGATRVFIHESKIWTNNSSTTEIYDPSTDTWAFGPSDLNKSNGQLLSLDNQIISFGGTENVSSTDKIKKFDFEKNIWIEIGSLPEPMHGIAVETLGKKIYVIGGYRTLGQNTSASSKVYSVNVADLNASVAGVYDLYRKDGNASAGTPLVQAEVADGSVTSSKIASNTITTSDLSEQILKYLKPEITAQPQGKIVYEDSNVSFSVNAEGKYLNYQWKKDGSNLTGETNATLNITDANTTQHDGNYSVVVSNDFGSVESRLVEVLVNNTTLMNGLVGWWKFDETNGTIAYDSSGNGHDGNLSGGPTWATGKIGGALSFDGVDDYVSVSEKYWDVENTFSVSLWYEIDQDFNSNGTIFCLGQFSDLNENEILLMARENGQKIRFYLHKKDHNWASRETLTDKLSFFHFVGVLRGGYEEDKIIVYLNGMESGTYYTDGNPSLLVNTNPRVLKIGKRNGEPVYPFKGLIDDIRIYDRALSAAEVQALYNLGQ